MRFPAVFILQLSERERTREIEFKRGEVVTEDKRAKASKEQNGTLVEFTPDSKVFANYSYRTDYIERMLWNYAYLNTGLTIIFNGKKFHSRNGLLDLLSANLSEDPLYPVIHLKDNDIEIAMTHTTQYGEEYYTFANGQHTTQGGNAPRRRFARQL